jgi:hypothetical protein
MTILKGSTYIAVVPLTAIVSQNLTNLFGFTKYLNLNLNLNLISLMLFPINLVFQMSDFRYEIKETSLPVIRTEILTEKSGFGPYQRTTNNWSWFLVDPVDDDDWRDRPRTDPSSVSDLGTGLGFSSSNELISARLYRDSFVQLRTLYPVSYRVSSLVSRFVYSTWT